MIKYFCDCCGDEITEKNRLHKDSFRAMVSSNEGDSIIGIKVCPQAGFSFYAEDNNNNKVSCKYCALKAINALEAKSTLPQSFDIESFKRIFFKCLDDKTGWGKNQIKTLFNDVMIHGDKLLSGE